MWGKLLQRDLFAPAATVIVLAVAVLVGALFYVGRSADQSAVLDSEATVANGVYVRMAEISALAADLAPSYDNVATLAGANHHMTLAIDRTGRTLSAHGESRPAPPERAAAFVEAALPLFQSVRQTASAGVAASGTGLQSSAVAVVGEEAFLLTATAARAGASPPMLLTVDRLDEAFLSTLSDRFLLDDARLELGDVAARGRARALLPDVSGAPAATLSWAPRKPGAALLRSALPPVAVLIAALGFVGWLLYRRGQEAARNLVASEARATHLAYHDALTGMPNRLLLADRLARAVEEQRRRGAPFAVHCIDLDRFKEVNDTFGHQAGDELIRLAAQKISAACRSVDTVARLGGDEFAIIQTHIDLAGADRLAERIVALLAEPMQLSVGQVHIGGSVGVTFVREASGDPQEYLRQADLALYRVKEAGRGRHCFFEEEMDATVRFRRTLQADLHAALVDETLDLHYQPQVDGGGQIVGLEALVRWTHPTRGQLSPMVFVPIAEECGLIEELGFFTLRRAFEDSRRWPDVRIAINVSATQLRMKSFVPRLRDLVAETGINPSKFELEITEGVLLGDDPQTHATLREVRDLGFTLALDDFGTGYSSLSYLQRYPVDKIKIDRSFVAHLGVDKEGEAVVAAIVRLARALHLSVIAEGVETNEQRLRLARAGCSEVQGYLFGRPSPPDVIDQLLTSETVRVPASVAV
jgi:diguanylate cyclase (GGDEF)-like protein